MKINELLKNECITLETRGDKQALSDLKNLKKFMSVCDDYKLNEIELNDYNNINVGRVGIELLKKILIKNYNSNIKQYNKENILKVKNCYCQLGSYVISKPALIKKSPNYDIKYCLYLVHSNTAKGIYLVNIKNIDTSKRLTLSKIINNGKKVLDI